MACRRLLFCLCKNSNKNENALEKGNETKNGSIGEKKTGNEIENKLEKGTSMEDSERSSERQKKGLTLLLTSYFIFGDVAGSGVLVLAKAFSETGWFGIFLLAFCCLVVLYSSILLGRCWILIEERCEDCRVPIRYPYPMIAQKAFGKGMRIFVSIVIELNIFGVAIVFLLLSSELLNSAIPWSISVCWWILIYAAFLCPLLWFGTPRDFWISGVLAMLTTVIACFIIIVVLFIELPHNSKVNYSAPSFDSFFLGYASLLYAFSGGVAFPTIQNDMSNRSQFPAAATLTFGCVFILYAAVASLGYYVYGDTVQSSLTASMPPSHSRSAVEILFAIHMFFAFQFVVNASFQDIEEYIGIPKDFGWKRLVFRTLILLGCVFVGASVPSFLKILNVVGATTGGLTAIIFPCLFYYKLCSKWELWKERKHQLLEKIVVLLIILTGIVGALISTYQSLADLVLANFCLPCYIDMSGKCNGT